MAEALSLRGDGLGTSVLTRFAGQAWAGGLPRVAPRDRAGFDLLLVTRLVFDHLPAQPALLCDPVICLYLL